MATISLSMVENPRKAELCGGAKWIRTRTVGTEEL